MAEYLRLIRIHQWHKNGFVLLGFFLLGDHQNLLLLSRCLLVTLAFCFISSAVYIINDFKDAASDRSHPIKKQRPLAAQTVKTSTAFILAGFFVATSLTIAYTIGVASFLIVIAYLVNNFVYTFLSKQLAIIDIFNIAFGFMLRIFAGTVGVGIFISEWMVITGFMLSLLIGFSKRFVEIAFSQNPQSQREVLKFYSVEILRSFILVMAAATIVTYALYTLSPRSVTIHNTTNLIYTTPIVIFGVLRYILLVFTTKADEDPANFLRTDRQLLAAIIVWAFVYGLIIV